MLESKKDELFVDRAAQRAAIAAAHPDARRLAEMACRCSEQLYGNRKLATEERGRWAQWLDAVLNDLISAK